MATLTVEDLPDELYAALSRAAKENGRSINDEAIVRLERGSDDVEPDVDPILKSIRHHREAMAAKGMRLTDEMLERGKNEGRH